jgi:DNA-binding XRE family transcriptional regulator
MRFQQRARLGCHVGVGLLSLCYYFPNSEKSLWLSAMLRRDDVLRIAWCSRRQQGFGAGVHSAPTPNRAPGRFFSLGVFRASGGDISSPTQLSEPAALSSVFGAKLHALRQQHGISQTSLARQLGLSSRAYISSLEAGSKSPSMALVTQIADLFMTTTDELFRNATPLSLTDDDDE